MSWVLFRTNGENFPFPMFLVGLQPNRREGKPLRLPFFRIMGPFRTNGRGNLQTVCFWTNPILMLQQETSPHLQWPSVILALTLSYTVTVWCVPYPYLKSYSYSWIIPHRRTALLYPPVYVHAHPRTCDTHLHTPARTYTYLHAPALTYTHLPASALTCTHLHVSVCILARTCMHLHIS